MHRTHLEYLVSRTSPDSNELNVLTLRKAYLTPNSGPVEMLNTLDFYQGVCLRSAIFSIVDFCTLRVSGFVKNPDEITAEIPLIELTSDISEGRVALFFVNSDNRIYVSEK